MPLPVAHGLIGASIIAATLPGAAPMRNWKLLLWGAALSVSPDLDYFLDTSWHRGFTHSLSFAAGVSLVCVAVARLENIRIAMGCVVAIFSHGLLDFATTGTMPGVQLLWPFTTRRFGLGLVDYYRLTGIDPVYFLGKDVLVDLIKMAMAELIIFLPIFLFVLSLKWSINKPSRS